MKNIDVLFHTIACPPCVSAACSLICATAMTFVATFDTLVPLLLTATTITIHSLDAENLTCACENAWSYLRIGCKRRNSTSPAGR